MAQAHLPRPGLPTRIFMFVSWLLFTVFVFGLPVWSYLFNDVGGNGARLCTLDAAERTCGNGVDNYTQLAEELGRTREDGSLWGCSCEEGVFGDWACRTSDDAYFSVSYYISTSPGTGAFSLFSAFPILFIWNYGGRNANTMGPLTKGEASFLLITISQVVFQIFFGLFLFASVCVFPQLHKIVVTLFLFAEFVHWTAITCGADSSRSQGIAIIGLLALGFVLTAVGVTTSLATAAANPSSASWFQRHAFYLGESSGLSITVAIPVLLVWITPVATE